jgi:hypothetical protein
MLIYLRLQAVATNITKESFSASALKRGQSFQPYIFRSFSTAVLK